MGDKTQTMIFDVDAQKLYMFDSKKKEADVWDMATFEAEISKVVDASGATASVKSNGQTKQIAAHSAAGYDMEVSMQSTMGGSKDMTMTVTLSGPIWIVKNAPGSADYARFYKAAVEKGWIFSDPRGAKAQPGQAKAMAEMYRQMAEIGGIPYETDVRIKIRGSGPMAGLLSKIGNDRGPDRGIEARSLTLASHIRGCASMNDDRKRGGCDFQSRQESIAFRR